MPYYADDFLDMIERELASERDALTRLVDRIDAIVAVRSVAIDVSTRLQRPIDVDDVFMSGRSEEERARLQALKRRILQDDQAAPVPALGGDR
jgi:hypothetical protein